MTPISQQLNGELFRKNEIVALLLDPATGPLFLRYALVTQGIQEHIFPATLLDDWGIEHNTLELYRWIYDQGQRFPRAEVFGFEVTGEATQVFLRALEIYDRLPVYVYSRSDSPIPVGVQVKHIFLPDTGLQGRPSSEDVPTSVDPPLRRAAVRWWRVNPHTLADYDFAPFPLPEDNGS